MPTRRVTVNQLVAFNIAWFRKAAGLTQDELGERLGGWSAASVSAAERSWDGKRVRKFNTDEIVGAAVVLGVPVVALLLPPPDAGTAVDYTFTAGPASVHPMGADALLGHLFPVTGGANSPPMRAFDERVIALGASGLLSPVVARAQLQAEQITSDARARAESLERDKQERHRQAMGSLIPEREELERRVNELRAFEREYHRRLIAFHEAQLYELKARGEFQLPPVQDPDAGP